MNAKLVTLNAFASIWLFVASMLAFMKEDVPAGAALLILAGATFIYAYRALTGRDARRHG